MPARNRLPILEHTLKLSYKYDVKNIYLYRWEYDPSPPVPLLPLLGAMFEQINDGRDGNLEHPLPVVDLDARRQPLLVLAVPLAQRAEPASALPLADDPDFLAAGRQRQLWLVALPRLLPVGRFPVIARRAHFGPLGAGCRGCRGCRGFAALVVRHTGATVRRWRGRGRTPGRDRVAGRVDVGRFRVAARLELADAAHVEGAEQRRQHAERLERPGQKPGRHRVDGQRIDRAAGRPGRQQRAGRRAGRWPHTHGHLLCFGVMLAWWLTGGDGGGGTASRRLCTAGRCRCFFGGVRWNHRTAGGRLAGGGGWDRFRFGGHFGRGRRYCTLRRQGKKMKLGNRMAVCKFGAFRAMLFPSSFILLSLWTTTLNEHSKSYHILNDVGTIALSLPFLH